MADDVILLARYTKDRDAEAFAELVRRYAGMVYGVCLRVAGNPHDAEDIAQECFIELARRSETIRTSLSGWLHRVAVTRAYNAVRSNTRRRRHEEKAANSVVTEPSDDFSWQEVASCVDHALEELPGELREPLILHFLEEKSQAEVAEQLGVAPSTISRRLDKGIGTLRGRLKKSGVLVPVALLATLLKQNAAVAAPVALKASLVKMAMAGVGNMAAAQGTAATTGGLAAMKTALIAVITAGIIAAGGIAVHSAMKEKEPPSAPPSQQSSTTPAGQQKAPPPAKTQTPAEINPKIVNEKVLFEANNVDWVDIERRASQPIARLSPDGEWLLYARLTAASGGDEGGGELYGLTLRNIETGEDKQLPYAESYPQWFRYMHITFNPFDPTGKQILYTRFHSERDAEMVHFDIATDQAVMTDARGRRAGGIFCGSKKRIIAMQERDLFVMAPPYRESFFIDFIPDKMEYPFCVSPDGTTVCLFWSEQKYTPDGKKDGPWQHYSLYDIDSRKKVADLPTYKDHVSLEDYQPLWTADGRFLCYYDKITKPLEGIPGQTRTIFGTNIWNYAAGKSMEFIEHAAPMGRGPKDSMVYLVIDTERRGNRLNRIVLLDAASGRTWNLDNPNTRFIYGAGDKICYIKFDEAGKFVVCVADVGL